MGKPPTSWVIDSYSSYYPKSTNAVIFSFRDNAATTIVDDYRGVSLTNGSTGSEASGPTWQTSSFPGDTSSNAWTLVSTNANPVTWWYKDSEGYAGTDGFVTLMAIYRNTGATNDGPRLLGNGTSGGACLEPCRVSDQFWTIANDVAHSGSGLSNPTGDWCFVGCSVKSGSTSEFYVRNYTAGTDSSTQYTYPTINSTNGRLSLASNGTNYLGGSNGVLYFAYVDPKKWTIAEMQAFSANVWDLYRPVLVTPVDQFTDTAGTVISSHTPTGGGFSWVNTGLGQPNTLVISDANRCRANDTGEVVYYADNPAANADYSTSVTFHYFDGSVGGFSGACVRATITGKKFYTLIYLISSGQWQLYWIDGGSYELLGSSSETLVSGNDYTITISIGGTSISCSVNGVVVITATDSRITARGYRALYASGTGSNGAGIHFDSFGVAYTAPTTRPDFFRRAVLGRRS